MSDHEYFTPAESTPVNYQCLLLSVQLCIIEYKESQRCVCIHANKMAVITLSAACEAVTHFPHDYRLIQTPCSLSLQCNIITIREFSKASISNNIP